MSVPVQDQQVLVHHPCLAKLHDSPLKRGPHNHEYYSHFLLFPTTTKVPTIVQMPKTIKANSRTIRKSQEKSQNIQLAVKAYTDPSSGLSLRAAAVIYGCSKNSITNHLKDGSGTIKHRYAPDIYIKRQLLNTAEETVLCNHIRECYASHLSFDVKLLHYYANQLLKARVGPLSEDMKIRDN
jgi:hypothetical protein